MHRRNWIKNIAGTAAASFLPIAPVLANTDAVSQKKRVLRIAHITDVHLHDKDNAPQLFEKCLHHIQNIKDAPDLIMNGGDAINDALLHTRSSVFNQWKTWHSVIDNNCSLPIIHCVGNHDIWGLGIKRKDHLYGKQFAQEMLLLEHTYYSFDRNGWHFIVLDSTHEKQDGFWYTAKLDEAQMEWLKNDLASTPAITPVMIISHIPILTASVFLDDYKYRYGKFHLPGAWMHTDVKEIVAVFNQFKNVKLCLSGHIHLADQVHYNEVSYFCNGAVSGDWWQNNRFHETPAGFAIVDLFNDGTFSNQYMPYLEQAER